MQLCTVTSVSLPLWWSPQSSFVQGDEQCFKLWLWLFIIYACPTNICIWCKACLCRQMQTRTLGWSALAFLQSCTHHAFQGLHRLRPHTGQTFHQLPRDPATRICEAIGGLAPFLLTIYAILYHSHDAKILIRIEDFMLNDANTS